MTQLKRLFLLAGALCVVGCSSAPERSSDSTSKTKDPQCRGSGAEKVCTCPSNYVLVDALCVPSGKCAQNNGGCDVHALCTPTDKDPICTCRAGYAGDGKTCTVSNGCGTCDPNATCQEAGTSGAACVCNAGYKGNGKYCEADPCANNGGCDVNATCSVTGAGSVVCTCNSPYFGNGTTCTLDPCANNGGCDVNATCSVTGGGSAVCTCNSPYVGNGKTCALNPCSTNNGGCDVNATCSTDSGQVECTCKGGYFGNGQTCRSNSTLSKLGSTCADSSQQAQSTCPTGLQCLPLTTANYCSKDCNSDADCAQGGAFNNHCVNVGRSVCLRGCDPADTMSCGRPDLACYEAFDSNTGSPVGGVCSAACDTDSDCTYGYRCLKTKGAYGVCDTVQCAGNNTCSNSGDVCYSRLKDGQSTKSCVSNCTQTGCPSGRVCNSSTKICDPVIRGTYETCGESVGQCAAGDLCHEFVDSDSLCLRKCATDTNCPSGSTCSVSDVLGKFCGVVCGDANSQNNALCPNGTSCAWWADSSHTKVFCGP